MVGSEKLSLSIAVFGLPLNEIIGEMPIDTLSKEHTLYMENYEKLHYGLFRRFSDYYEDGYRVFYIYMGNSFSLFCVDVLSSMTGAMIMYADLDIVRVKDVPFDQLRKKCELSIFCQKTGFVDVTKYADNLLD